ncbi:hypothetical protein ES707_03378 [subsurface metagenome]
MVKLKQHRAPIPSETIWKLGPIDHVHETRPIVTVETRQFISSKSKPKVAKGYKIILIQKLNKLDTTIWLEVKVDVEK